MKLIKLDEGKAKAAARHTGQCGLDKVSAEMGSKRLRVSVSHFLPQMGAAEMYPSPTERAYYGLSGTIVVKGKNGDEYVVGPGDTLFIPPGEERSIEVPGTEVATMLVIVVTLD